MKKVLLTLLALVGWTAIYADSIKLSVPGVTMQPGETKTLTIDATNDVTIGSLTLTLELPKCLSFTAATVKKALVLTDRKPEGATSSASFQDSDKKIIRYNTYDSDGNDGTGFVPGEGAIYTFEVKMDDDAAPGRYEIKVYDATGADLSGEVGYKNIITCENGTVTVPYPVFTISTADSEYGEIEGARDYMQTDECTLTATAIEGYHFVKWSNDVTENPYTFVVEKAIELSAEFAPNKYAVTFMNGETTVTSVEAEYKSKIIAPEDPTKEGHTFIGWYNGEQKLQEDATVPIDGVTYEAKYTVNSYKLSFVIGETVVSEENVEYGSAVVAPDAPEKEGHTFAGWVGVPETMPAKEVTISGSYTVNSYKLSFVIGETVVSEENVEYGSAVVAPEAPAKEGHTFAGWVGVPETMPAGDVTISGSYTVNSYKLSYEIDGEVVSEEDVEYGAALPEAPEADEKEGHTFAGWSEAPETMPAGDVTISGSYTVNSYKLSFVIGETVVSEENVEYGSAVVAPEAPAKEGHTFAGWNEIPETMPAKEVTISGSYTVNSYKLIYKIDGEVVSEEDVEYGAKLSDITVPTKEGYTYTWDKVDYQTMPAHEVIVKGTCTVNTYTVTYKNGDEVIRVDSVEYGATLPEAPEAPEVADHNFKYWEGLPETMPAHDVIVIGFYTLNSYKLQFVIEDKIIEEYELEYGATLPEAPEAPAKEGHSFAGWDEIPETMPADDVTISGSYTVNSYKLIYEIDGEVVSQEEVEYGTPLTAMEAPQIEGYTFSEWSEIPETMPAKDVTISGFYTINYYTLVFVIGDDVISWENVEYGSYIDVPEAPAKEGHTFAGWDEIPETMPAGDVTIIGSYTVNSYKLIYEIDGEVVSQEEVEYGTPLTAMEAPQIEGYTFSEWSEIPVTMPAEDVTISGFYTINTYKLTYVVDGVVVVSTEVEYGSPITAIKMYNKTGYTFSGWDNLPETMPANDVIVNGAYTVNTYTVTYMIGDEVIRVDEVEYGATLPEAPEAPALDDYNFRGWSDIPATMPAGDIVITGSYESGTGISAILSGENPVNVYDLRGNLVESNVKPSEIKSLPRGIYIINRQKVAIK